MPRNARTILRALFFGIFALVIAGYAYLTSRDFVAGPQILVAEPAETVVFSPLVRVAGTALHVSFISLNDRQIFTDAEGNFREQLLLAPGYNILSIKAKDRFERRIEKTLELILVAPQEKQTLL